jgi:hypothetical protein
MKKQFVEIKKELLGSANFLQVPRGSGETSFLCIEICAEFVNFVAGSSHLPNVLQ